MTQIVLTPIGRVRSNVTAQKEDYWGNIVSVIEFEKGQLESEALKGLEDFSHVEVLFHLSDVPESSIERGGRHPRNNPNWPKVGILAQRPKARPNRIAATICQVIEVGQTSLTVRGLDAFDGSPVLDIKPILSEFLPNKGQIKQPQWSHEMMEHYFQSDISTK